jgi:hypothetical protein
MFNVQFGKTFIAMPGDTFTSAPIKVKVTVELVALGEQTIYFTTVTWPT